MPGILCEHCTAACCRYIALPIETPTERSDFDDIRWYLLHENVSVFVEDGDWYISMLTNCRHVQADGRCAIYARRPRICRKYTTENCDYHSGDYGWEAHFTCPEHLDEYVRTRQATIKNNSHCKNNSKDRKCPDRSNNSLNRVNRIYKEFKKDVKKQGGRRASVQTELRDLYGRPLPGLGRGE